MKRKKTVNSSEKDLHEIKNKKRLRAVKDKKRGVRLKRVSRRKTKALVSVSLVGVLAFGIFGLGALGNPDKNVVDPGFGTVAYELPADGSTPDQHTGIENIGYMNTRFMAQTAWYSEMHSSVDTIMSQTVDTYKQFSRGILVQLDIAKSALINEAQQFCWTDTDVLWRTTTKNVSSWTGIDMPWNDFDLQHRTIYDFVYEDLNGLPGTSFSVYILREETVLEAEPVIVNADGTYSQTFHLDPEKDKAPAHYGNQMVFKGGLSAPPTFDYITVTYTFDSTWQVLVCEVEEKYTATKSGIPIPASCVSTSVTRYEYGTERAEHTAYDEYFQYHLDSPITDNSDGGEITAVECLGAAFAPMLSEPATLALTLDVNGYTLNGLIGLDMSTMNVSADIQNGAIRLWYENGEAYLSYGGLKIKLNVTDLLALFGGAETASSESGGGFSLDSILADLAKGEFTLGENTAHLSSTLDLTDFIGLSIPVEFSFTIGENNSVSLDKVQAEIVFDGLPLGATMRFSNQTLPALSESDKGEYIEFAPYVKSILSLAQEDVIHAALTYQNGEFSLNGEINLSYQNDFALTGELLLQYAESCKTLCFAYLGDTVYFDLDGIRVCTNVKEAAEFIGGLMGERNHGSGIDAVTVLQTLFAEEFINAFCLTEENESAILSVKATQILELLGLNVGIDGLDRITLSVTQDGSITAEALGAAITVSKGEAVSFDTDGYIDLLPYVKDLTEIFTSEAVNIAIDYQSEMLSLNGTVAVNTESLQVQGALTLTYQDAEIPVSFYYADGEIYLNVYDLKIRTELSALLGLVSGSGDSALSGLFGGDLDLSRIGGAVSGVLTKLFAFETDELFGLSESDGVLSLVLDGAKLLSLFTDSGFDPGIITVTVQDKLLSLNAFNGLNVEITGGKAFSAAVRPDNYTDVSETLALLAEALENGALSIGGSAEITFGEINVTMTADGVISWKEGFSLYLDVLFGVNGVEQRIVLKADRYSLQAVYGSVGVHIAFEDLGTLENAIVELYGTLKSFLDESFRQESPIPNLESFDDLLTLLEGAFKTNEILPEIGEEFNLGTLLREIVISSSHSENGICEIVYQDLVAELVNTLGGVGLQLHYAGEGFTASASFEASAYSGSLPVLPENVTYLSIDDFVVMLDYVGAAIQTLAQDDLKVTISAQTTGTSEGQPTLTTIDGTILYHTGGDVLFTVDTEETSLTVTTNLYLNVSLQILSGNGNTYLDLLVFDFDDNDELDFFVTLSMFAPDESKYAPLKIYAPASEIMTVLSAGLSVFGVNTELLNQYMIEKWLGMKTAQQLHAFGSMLEKSMGLEDGLFGLFKSAKSIGSQGGIVSEAFIRSITAGNHVFNVTLDSSSLYGTEGLKDVTFEISKENGLLTGVSLNNVYNSGASEVTSVAIGISAGFSDELTRPQTLEGYFNVSGIGALLKALANTATHDELTGDGAVEYVMNENFYIEGVLKVNLNAISIININISVNFKASVDLNKDGSVLIKVRLNYDGKSIFGIGTAINGDTNQLDMAIDLTDSMVYMKRVETTNKKDTVEYRAMPLNVFFQDILNQLGFMLNFGSLVTKYLPQNLSGSGEKEVTDYGTMFNSYLSGFETAGNESAGYTWTIRLNGNALTGGVMSDIVVTIGTIKDSDGNPMLRTLGISTTVSTGSGTADKFVSIGISTSTPLTVLNPKGVMDEGVQDNLDNNLSADLKGAIGKAYAEAEAVDWMDAEGNYIYISGVLTTVTFMVEEEVIPGSEQAVLYDGNTYELYAELKYPDLSEYEREGYSLLWDEVGDKISPNQMIKAHYTPNLYDVRFVSSQEISGWEFDRAAGLYYFDTQMDYGSAIDLYEGDDDLILTYYVSVGGNVFELPSKEGRIWKQADIYQDFARFTSYGTPDKVTYVSAIDFTYDGITYSSGYVKNFEKDYTLFEADKISAEYTFLGWYMQTESGWVAVDSFTFSDGASAEYVVEAVWQITSLNVDSVNFNRSGTWNYTNTVTINITECELIGAWASDGSVTKKTVFDYTITGTTVGVKLTGQTESTNFSVNNSFNIMYWVSIMATTTYMTSDGRVLYTESSQGSN